MRCRRAIAAAPAVVVALAVPVAVVATPAGCAAQPAAPQVVPDQYATPLAVAPAPKHP